MFRVELRDLAATVGWAVVLSSIISPALYVRDSLAESDFVLLFFGSAIVGAVLADLERLIISCVVAITSSLAIIYVCLNLPVILNLAVAGEALGVTAVVMIFRAIFPISIVVILFGGLLGSFVGERLNLR